MSAPAASTLSTSSPKRAKLAERMDGAIQGCMVTPAAVVGVIEPAKRGGVNWLRGLVKWRDGEVARWRGGERVRSKIFCSFQTAMLSSHLTTTRTHQRCDPALMRRTVSLSAGPVTSLEFVREPVAEPLLELRTPRL